VISVFFADIRDDRLQFFKGEVERSPNMTVLEAIRRILGEELTTAINNDLHSNNSEVTVSWNNLTTGKHSNIGGVGSLNWAINDNIIVTIVYDNEATSPEQEDKMITWMLNNQPT
jgi:hypothetical protein